MSEYLNFARAGLAKAVDDADVEGYLFGVLMNPEEALLLQPDEGYHTVAHAFRVATYAYWAGKLAGLLETELLELLVAGLFHDAGHSKDAEMDDRDNVAVAVSVFRSHDFDWVETEKVVRLIQVTTVEPYKVRRVKVGTLQEQIMADADLLVWADRQFEQHLMFGLGAEGNDPMSAQEYFGMNGCFTEVARAIYALNGLDVHLY